MAEKLRSILGRIPWSLLVKAGIVGASWMFLPLWSFFLLGIYFYFVPFFQPARFLFPFVLALFLGVILPHSAAATALIAFAFFLILGIKDLVFVDRGATYEIMIFLLLFLLSFGFFREFAHGGTVPFALVLSLGIGLAFFVLVWGLIHYVGVAHSRRRKFITVGTLSFLLWELTAAVLFLPIHFLSQAALVFILGAIFSELALEYSSGTLTRERITTKALVASILIVVIFGTARWSL